MALPTQLIDLPFAQGVDTKTNPQLSARPSRLEDVVFVGGTLQKRWGRSGMTRTIDTGGNLSAGGAIFPYDSELVRLSSGNTYSLGTQQNNWTTKPGYSTVCTHSIKQIVHKSSSQDDFDHAYANGITVTSWIDSGVHIAVYDESSGDFYQTGATALTSTSGRKGTRCVALGTKVLVFFVNPQHTLYVAIVDTNSPETVPSVISLETDLYGDATLGISYDAIAFGSSYAIVGYLYGVDESIGLYLIAVNSSGAVLGSPGKTDRGSVAPNTAVKLHIDRNNVGYAFIFGNSATYLAFNTSTFAQVKALTTIDDTSALEPHSLCATAEVTTGSVTVFLSTTGGSYSSGFADKFMSYAVVTSSAVTTACAAIPGTGGLVIQGDGVVVNGQACCLIMNDATAAGEVTLQPTGWLMNTAGNVLAKVIPGVAANQSGQRIMRPFTAPSGAFAFLMGQQGVTSYSSQDGTIISTTPRGVTRIDISQVYRGIVPSLRLGQCVYIGGSEPRAYDGQEMVEAGPNIFPEDISVSLGSSGALSAGSYQWRVVYTWINARGEFQRSAPSPAVSATASATQKATLTIPTQRLSGRDIAGISTTQVEVYRTEANGTLFYRLSSVTSPTLNNINTDVLTYVDSSVSDSALISNELLYTTGGVNDSVAPPGYTIACEHKTRLCVALLDDPYAWQSSSETIVGEMLRFNESWGGRVPASTGPITAMASLDGNLIIFTTQAAYLVNGDGPDLSGNNNWPPPQRITSVDTGAVSWQSVISTNAGIFFQNSRGFYLLDRGLACEYVGADVEKYAGWIVRCVAQVPNSQQIRYQIDLQSTLLGQMQGDMVPCNGALCLVYDYYYKHWSIFPDYDGSTSCIYQGKYLTADVIGTAWPETPGVYGDQVSGGNRPVQSVVETQWIKVSGIQGFQRIKRALLLGTYGSNCTITWEAAYDYSPDYSDSNTVTIDGNDVAMRGGHLQLRLLLSRQKCEAVKFRFTDSNVAGSGQGMTLTSLTLEVGVKSGPFRLPARQSY